MESRVAVLENDVRNIKDNVARLHDGMTAANTAITQLLTGQAQLRGDIDGLRKELKGDIGSLRAELKGAIDTLVANMETREARLIGRMEAQEKKIQRWFFATSLSCAGLAFTAVRLFH